MVADEFVQDNAVCYVTTCMLNMLIKCIYNWWRNAGTTRIQFVSSRYGSFVCVCPFGDIILVDATSS